MATLLTNNTSSFPLTEDHFALLDKIGSRDFTDWLHLPEDKENVVELINNFVQEKEGTWDKIIALGMGGSALGITTLKQAFFPFDDRLIVIDNLDSNTIDYRLSTIDPQRTLVLIISKSGGTLETMTAYEIFKEIFSPEDYQKNFIAITDPENGKLREIAEQDGLTTFPIPPEVGGRFSVLTSVGLLPFALLGGDMDKLLNGAKKMKKRCFEKSEDNPALQLAIAAFELSKTGHNIISFFSYSDQLYSLSLWYQQLLAESIGKTTKVGLTPLPLRGASDQHSVLQLLQDGPNNKLNIFLKIQHSKFNIESKFKIKNSKLSLHDILNLELEGTEQALREDGRPTLIIEIPELTEEALGELFFLLEMQIAILGELYEIDAYNQPGVEKSKKIVKEALLS